MVGLTKAPLNQQLKMFNKFSIVGGQVNFKAFYFQNSSHLDLTGVYKVATNKSNTDSCCNDYSTCASIYKLEKILE